MRQRAVTGAAIDVLRGFGVRVLGLIGTLVLARLLTPHDLGIIAVGATFVTFANSRGRRYRHRADPPCRATRACGSQRASCVSACPQHRARGRRHRRDVAVQGTGPGDGSDGGRTPAGSVPRPGRHRVGATAQLQTPGARRDRRIDLVLRLGDRDGRFGVGGLGSCDRECRPCDRRQRLPAAPDPGGATDSEAILGQDSHAHRIRASLSGGGRGEPPSRPGDQRRRGRVCRCLGARCVECRLSDPSGASSLPPIVVAGLVSGDVAPRGCEAGRRQDDRTSVGDGRGCLRPHPRSTCRGHTRMGTGASRPPMEGRGTGDPAGESPPHAHRTDLRRPDRLSLGVGDASAVLRATLVGIP